MLIFLLLFAFSAHAENVKKFTIVKGPFTGAELRVDDAVVIKGKKKKATAWGKIIAIEVDGEKAMLLIQEADPKAQQVHVRSEDVFSEKDGELEVNNYRLRRGQLVIVPGQEAALPIETIFYGGWVLAKNFSTREHFLVPALDLKVSENPIAPVLPHLRLEIFGQTVSSNFDLRPSKAGEASLLTYRPAQSYYLGFSAGYRGIGASYAFGVPAGAKVRSTEGTSQFTDLRLNYYVRRFGVELAYSKYSSFILENSASLSPATLGNETFFKLPQLSATGYGATFFYVFSPEIYSLPASIDHSDAQAASAGSLLAVASYRKQEIRNDGPIIPLERRAQFGDLANLSGFKSSSYAVGPGYGYLWLPGYKFLGDFFFVAPLLALSLGYESLSEDVQARTLNSGSVGLNVHARFAFGWNAPHFFTVFEFLSDAFAGHANGVQLSSTHTSGKLAVGARF